MNVTHERISSNYFLMVWLFDPILAVLYVFVNLMIVIVEGM